MIKHNVKDLPQAGASLQQISSSRRDYIQAFIDSVSEKNNRFVTYTHDSDEGEYSEAGFFGDFVDIYQKEIKTKPTGHFKNTVKKNMELINYVNLV